MYETEAFIMKKLPIFLSLEGKKILVVGGARAALIKIKTLLEAEADFMVIAKYFLEETESLLKQAKICYEKKEVTIQDLKNIFLIFAGADRQTNDMIYLWAKQKNILCCKADGKGDFIVPAHKREGSLTLAVSTDGLFPLLGKKICNDMDLSVGKKLECLAEQRKKILQTIPKQEQKKALQELLKE